MPADDLDDTPLLFCDALIPNGFLVVAPTSPALERSYHGMDDFVWPLEGPDDTPGFALRMGIPPQMEGVCVATVWPEVLDYWERCITEGLSARLLHISTQYSKPQAEIEEHAWEFIGFDAADPLGEHSLIRHQLIGETAPQLQHWRTRLNQHGLFPSRERCEEFLRELDVLEDRWGIPPIPQFEFVPVLLRRYTRSSDV